MTSLCGVETEAVSVFVAYCWINGRCCHRRLSGPTDVVAGKRGYYQKDDGVERAPRRERGGETVWTY